MANCIKGNRIKFFVAFTVVLLSAALLLAACRGVKISGKVTAPGALIAFQQSDTNWKGMLARLLDSEAVAQVAAMAPVSHARVRLIRIDDSGKMVAVLGTTHTDRSGNYALNAPAGLEPSANYLIEVGSNVKLSAFVTGTTVDIDPYTTATVALVTGAVSDADASLASVSLAEIAAVQEVVVQNSGNLPVSLSASQMVSSLEEVILNNLESNNIVNNIVSSGTISGTVTDANHTPLADIRVGVRTFGNQVTQAFTRTDPSGNYTLSVPPGDYIIGAGNDTTQSRAAGQWWTAAGTPVGMWGAEKVTVGTSPVTIDFHLANGGRISGKVTGGATGTPLGGILVALSDFSSQQTLGWVFTKTDGTYTYNVAPGKFFVSFRNYTLAQPYASGNYNRLIPGGSFNAYQAEKIIVTEGTEITANINLMDGGMVQGTVTDPADGAIAGIPVRFHDYTGAFSEGAMTGADGSYHLWLQPSPFAYSIYTRGQIATVTVSAGASATQDFGAPMSKITATVQDAAANPVRMALSQIYSTSAAKKYAFLGYTFTNGDGSVVHYASPEAEGSVYLTVTPNAGQMAGSQAYDGQLNYPANGTPIPVPSPAGGTIDLGAISLPPGTILTGLVKSAATGEPLANSFVQIRYGGYSDAYRLLTTRTMVDGSYAVSLPANSLVSLLSAAPWNYTPGAPNTYFPNFRIGPAGTTAIAPTLAY